MVPERVLGEPVEPGSAANAIVSTFPDAEVALRPPCSAKPAISPTWPGSVVTPLNPCELRQGAVSSAVYGFEFRTPQPAARSTTARTIPSLRATRRL